MVTSDAPGASLAPAHSRPRRALRPGSCATACDRAGRLLVNQATRKPDGWSARGRRHRSGPQGVSAAVGDLHRAGAPRARSSAALPLALYSLRHPTDREAHPIHAEIRAPVVYLPEYLHHEPLRVFRAWLRARRLPGYRARRRRVVARLPPRPDARAGSAASGRRSCWPPSCRTTSSHLHAHFLHTPASVTRYAALLRGAALELLRARQGHLDDARMGEARKARRLRVDDDVHRSQCAASARSRASGPDRRPQLPRHRHAAISAAASERMATATARDPQRPVRILAVGRAVDKKGFDDLLAALAQTRARPALAIRAHRRRADAARAQGAGAPPRHRGARSNGAARRRKPPSSTPTGPRTSSRCRAASATTATATACPMCCSKPKARSCRACRRASPASPS